MDNRFYKPARQPGHGQRHANARRASNPRASDRSHPALLRRSRTPRRTPTAPLAPLPAALALTTSGVAAQGAADAGIELQLAPSPRGAGCNDGAAKQLPIVLQAREARARP